MKLYETNSFDNSSTKLANSSASLADSLGTDARGLSFTAGNGKEDFVLFNNEDNITGKLLGITEGNMVFQSALYKDGLKIPLQTVDTIHLSNFPEPFLLKGRVSKPRTMKSTEDRCGMVVVTQRPRIQVWTVVLLQ